MSTKIDNVYKQRDVQHSESIHSLRWQRGLLFSLIVAVLGYIGEQVFQRVFAGAIH